MKDNVNIILTFQDYFDAVHFDTRDLKEKVAYVLYYVTEISALRKDMLPKIIAHRINDQIRLYHRRCPLDEGEKIILTSAEEVLQIMTDNPSYFVASEVGDYRDRNEGEIAYVLTKSKSDELKKEFNTDIKRILERYKKKSRFETFWTGIWTVGILLLAIYLYFSTEYKKDINVRNLSQNEFLETVDFQNCSDEEKGVFFTYYITQLTKLRDDITPHVICERISSLKYGTISEDKMRKIFDESNLVKKSQIRDSAYVMTRQGIEKVENLIANKSRENVVTITWILDNVSITTVVGFISLLIGLITSVFIWGYQTASIFKD